MLIFFQNCDHFDTQMKNKFNEDLYYIEYYDMFITRLDDLFLGPNIA